MNPSPEYIASVREQAIAITYELTNKLSALGVPFICLVGIPGDVPPGDTIRISKGLTDPQVNLRMRLETERYTEFMANQNENDESN